MASWQEKVEQVMLADTSDLRKLARMVGHDPITFWRDANFRHADLSDQDLSGIDLSKAVLPHDVAKGSVGQILFDADVKENVRMVLETAMRAMDDALADWPNSPKHINAAIKALRSVIKHSKEVKKSDLEAEARHIVAEANVLLGEYASADTEIRRARKLNEVLGQDAAVAECLDSRGMSLRLRAYRQDQATAVESLERANSVFQTAQKHNDVPRNQIRAFSIFRDAMSRLGETDKESVSDLRTQVQTLERIWSPITSFVSADTHVAAKIAHSAHRIALAKFTRKELGASARETLRENLTDAIGSAATNRLYLDWMDGQHWLTELDKFDGGSTSETPTEENRSLDAAQKKAVQRALMQLASGDAKISELMSGSPKGAELLDEALECYAEAENLYGLLEDITPRENEPGRNHALIRRGIAYLLKTTDQSLSGEAMAEAIQEGSFALDLAAANLAARTDVPLALADAWDAQAFGLRLEAHFSTEEAAAVAISQAMALHRRASKVEGLPRAVSYRYRVHFFGAERELEERRHSRPEKFKGFRVRAENALDSIETRSSSRTSAAERASYMALMAECVMSRVAELKLASPADVKDRWGEVRDETLHALGTSTKLATGLFMPLDWAMLKRVRAQLTRLDEI